MAGPQPETIEASSEEDEIAHVAKWLSARIADGMKPDEIGLIARTDDAAERGARACEAALFPSAVECPGPSTTGAWRPSATFRWRKASSSAPWPSSPATMK